MNDKPVGEVNEKKKRIETKRSMDPLWSINVNMGMSISHLQNLQNIIFESIQNLRFV